MKKYILFIGVFFNALVAVAQDARVISECTVVYDLTIEDASVDQAVVKSMAGTTKTVYIKGSKARTELVTPAFQQSVIYDGRTDSTIILRELGNSRYMSFLNAAKRAAQHKRFDGITFTYTNDTKTILGYECKRVEAKLKDGAMFNIYYAPSIVPSNRMFEYQFKDLPGFVLEYETLSEDGKTKVNYTATKISLTPVPAAKFDLPKTGYRII